MARIASTPETDGRVGRRHWLRLRTLILLRWMAIAGQTAAILVAWRFFGVALDMALCLSLVGLLVLANLFSAILLPRTRRLSEAEALAVLIFDSLQLAGLLFLTGGLNNPFALLILAPATIAATALTRFSAAIIGGLTAILVTALGSFFIPLRLADGALIEVPRLFGFGFWLAIIIGIAFLAVYARRVTGEMQVMSDALLATQMALARERRLTDLSGIVAAAAHELGTPLATIKLASAELASELSDQPLLQQDAELIRDQADRCRDILRSMGRMGKDDLHLRTAPFAAVVEEAADPHRHRGRTVHIHLLPGGTATQPAIRRQPEVIHGLRNLVQNAVDFSRANVWIDLDWTDREIALSIIDDGPGFPAHLMGRLGDPFTRGRARTDTDDRTRPEYEGMGLGLFIAKTLLERTGAALRFSNATDPFLAENERPQKCGARIEVRWPRAGIDASDPGPLGENQPLPS